MSFQSFSSPQSVAFFSKPFHGHKPPNAPTSRIRASSDVPDFLSADWLESRRKRPFGPRLNFSAEDAVRHQLDALMFNDQPRQDYGIEVMYRFAGFDPFERSTYFGPFFDLGQFERFRRIFHHSTYRVLLGHKERKILSCLMVKEGKYKQRVWVRGSRPEEEEVFQFTMAQRVGGSWDGYWLTESLLHDELALLALIFRFCTYAMKVTPVVVMFIIDSNDLNMHGTTSRLQRMAIADAETTGDPMFFIFLSRSLYEHLQFETSTGL
ncbi:hypothetical protein Vadar_021482 [Vaccinium darrowii]|uniref:Uncharacterized protein n=1 Tax=Vaccinium darrowii TaxID=229202 RepID=A0ACB7Y1F7_9ERIC|nr:hypothetical protein Vadar_021482 [Vaccinium darrowii]